MNRILLVLLLVLGWSAGAAAQTLPGAFTIPTGSYEYRWKVTRNADGSVQRTPARGYLRLHDNGRFVNSLEREGTLFSRESGAFDAADGNMLYMSRLIPSEMRTQADTFVVRHAGDRLFLWQNLHGAGRVEYELARQGAPASRTVPPGVIPSLYGYVAEILYFEGPGGTAPPRPERRFTTTFASASTRYVYVQLQVEYPMNTADVRVPIHCRIRDGEGRVVNESAWEMNTQRGSASSFPYLWWGAATPGSIAPGTYRVNCTIGGAEMMEGTFQVT